MRSIGISVLLLCCGSLAACDTAEDTEVADDTTAATYAPAADAAATPAPTDTVGTIVRVSLREWAIGLSQSTVPAGRVQFQVSNEGQYEHAFEVEGAGIEEETDHLQRGGTATLSLELPAGTYELYCPIDDTHGKHEELGMRTTLVVQ